MTWARSEGENKMTRQRRFLVSMASSVAMALCLAGAAPSMAQSKYAYVFVTGDTEDAHFNQPYIDVEEWRDEPADVPNVLGDTTQNQGLPPVKVRHLYVHGGFK